jgi:hypothetical protein
MSLDRSQCFISCINGDWHVEIVFEIGVDQHREACDVIEVRMRQKHVPNVVQFLEAKVTYTGAGIDQNVIIDEHCGSA